MNNNNFGHSAYAHQGPGYQINAAGGTVNNTVYHERNGTPIQMKDCWKSLAFPEMENRYYDIDAVQPGTCEWFPQHRMYMGWDNSNRGLLWIKGKPGSGKSTLLRHALESAKKKRNVKEKPLILSFFFHGRGAELQRTPPGFYRSLLHQLSKIPDAVSDVVDTFKEKCETFGEVGKTWQWHPKQLRELFESSIREALKLRPICLFVDALDECGEEDAKMLAQRFKDLLDSLRSTAYKSFHICFTCRPYPVLTLKNVFEIYVESENRTDISNFVQYQLSDIGPTIRDLITERANGVFLWASLIVKQISSLHLEARKEEQMKEIILRVPLELDKLYRQLIKGMKSDSLRLIQCVCVAIPPFSIAALRWAIVTKTKPPYSSLQECRGSSLYQPDDESMKRVIQTLSHGLVEVTSNRKVQFIHQTVKDFFVDKGLRLLERPKCVPDGITESDFTVGMAHNEMSKICLRWLALGGKTRVYRALYPGRRSHNSLLTYALETWMIHAGQSEQRGISQDDFLDFFAWPSEKLDWLWQLLYRNISFHHTRPPCPLACLFHVALAHGLTGLLQAMLGRATQTQRVIDEKNSDGQTPLMLAAMDGLKAMAMLLLEHGADIHMKDTSGRTPLFLAAQSGHESVVRLLLEHGADINAKEYLYSETPLSFAAGRGDKNTLQLLLEHGADINAKGISGRTPLSIAAAEEDKSTLELLLEHGADISARDVWGDTQLSFAASDQYDKADIMQLLLEHGADIDTKDKKGRTPLFLAAQSGHEGRVRLLLEHGADIDTKDKKGRTPLFLAAQSGHEGLVRLLLKHGATCNINIKDFEGRTPLLIATAERDTNPGIIQLLLEHGAACDINVKDRQGRTPLSIAAYKGDKRTLQLLRKYRDDRNA